MTIIVAFILDAFVFRMNYSRKNREPVENPEGGTECLSVCACACLYVCVHSGHSHRMCSTVELKPSCVLGYLLYFCTDGT